MTRLPAERPLTAADAVAVSEPFARLLATKFYAAGLDSDDIVQAGRIGAWKAWRDWRGELGVPWSSFATLCMEREVITTVKTARRAKHGPVSTAASLHAPLTEDGASLAEVIPLPTADTLGRVLAREELRRLLWAVEEDLTDVEQRAIAGVLAGLSYDEIADDLASDEQVGRKTVDNALQRAKRKLRPAA